MSAIKLPASGTRGHPPLRCRERPGHRRPRASCLVLAALLSAAVIPGLPAAHAVAGETEPGRAAPPGASRTAVYHLLPDSCTVRATTGSSGLFGFLGHEHTIAIPIARGTAAIDTSDPTRFTLAIEAEAESLRVLDDDPERQRKVERTMKDDVLETGKHPFIVVTGRAFTVNEEPGAGTLAGDLVVEVRLHGVLRDIELPLVVERRPDGLRARGGFTVRHDAFEMQRVKVAGVVNVAEAVAIEFDVRGVRVVTGRDGGAPGGSP